MASPAPCLCDPVACTSANVSAKDDNEELLLLRGLDVGKRSARKPEIIDGNTQCETSPQHCIQRPIHSIPGWVFCRTQKTKGPKCCYSYMK